MRSFGLWKLSIAACLIILLAASAVAQTGTSSVVGTVADQTGGVIPNAKVTLTNLETRQVRTQTTNPMGAFTFEFIQPGDYQVQVETAGFKKTTLTVHALIAKPVELAVKLEVGGANEVVEVTAANTVVAVNTSDSALGNNFVNSQITNLPMEARNVVSLLTLQPGVTGAPDTQGYVAGARSDQSNVTLDGVNINDAETNRINVAGALTGPVLRLNSEAIEEFRVSTTTANANAGRSSGAQIELVTKGGTNNLHGALFEYNRSRGFTSNEYFTKLAGQERAPLIRNTFGGALGGPIKKDKLFFFYSYEGRRDASYASSGPNRVPTPELGQGTIQFLNDAGNMVSLNETDIRAIFPDVGGYNPVAVQALANAATRYPANDDTIGDGFNTRAFRWNAPAPVKLNSHVAKLDFNISSTQTAFLRVNALHDHDGSASLQYFPDTTAPMVWNHPWGIAASHTWTLSGNLVNNFRYGLTRESISRGGDLLTGNDIWFRYIFYPWAGTRTTSRMTPVQNFVDDISWVKGKHTFQFGTYITTVANNRISYGGSYDTAVTNPSYYAPSMVVNSVNAYLYLNHGYKIDTGWNRSVDSSITALIGRYTEFTGNFNFDSSGNLMPVGAPTTRSFASQGYEGYAQDNWKLKPNLTFTYGLRYNLARPVYERNGYETQPEIPLGQYFQQRTAAMQAGNPYYVPIVVNLSGPANNGPTMYNWDKTVFLPRAALAWSPGADEGIWKALFGGPGKSVLRGGFAITSDYFGQALASFFDTRNTLGFSSSYTNPANTFNLGCGQYVGKLNSTGTGVVPFRDCVPVTGRGAALGPLFTGFDQNIRALVPSSAIPSGLTFPQQQPFLDSPSIIESSLDSKLVTPRSYVFTFTFERDLPHSTVFQVSYLGRLGRHLLAQRDIATPANLVDPVSHMDWYTAATMLEKLRQQGTPSSSITAIPYFENLFSLANLNAAWCPEAAPNCYTSSTQAIYDWEALYWANDWTDTMLDIDSMSNLPAGPDGVSHAFFQPQYGALQVWSTIGNSNYHALAASLRHRGRDLSVDLNYTWSHSLDDASALQSAGSYSSAGFIPNPWRQRDNYANSDFDLRHQINVNAVWQMPFGKGKTFGSGASKGLDAIIGGWQLSGIYRWNTGSPFSPPYDDARWSTNFNLESNTTPTRPVPLHGCPTRGSNPNFFGACDRTAIYQSFRPSYPGEGGPRNIFRMPNYVVLDMGLTKRVKMPYSEGHELQFRWEVFNVTNTQHFGQIDTSPAGWGLGDTPALYGSTPEDNWGSFTAIQGDKRVMQFGLRYSF